MNDGALIAAILFDGQGGGRDCTEQEILSWTPDQGTLWLHFNYGRPDIREWLVGRCGLSELTAQALTAPEPRPRSHAADDKLLLVLRGVNLNPGSDLLDMVSLRAWLEPARIITVRNRKVMAIDDLRRALDEGSGPRDSGDFLAKFSERLTQRISAAIGEIEEAEDVVEDQVIGAHSYKLRPVLSGLRRQLIDLRRYLAPQRQVLMQLQSDELSWLNNAARLRIREVADQVTRYVEELDATRDRAAVAQDELESRLAEQMNRNMYVLSVVASIFLPLGLLTGLLGINVGGIPGANHPLGFYIVSAVLISIAALQVWWFRSQRVI
jgi:zinc transporter